ncbi:hypothetical protein MO973_12235 [Paenibacillus sp. TRM 82003]|nr:hypothetical protein [Paenibacillus sp. TRM 82003]
MNTSPITSWEGAEAYFTFGPDSFGVWFSVIAAVVLFIGFIAYSVRHEKHRFAESVSRYPELREKLERSRYAPPREPEAPVPLPSILPPMPSLPQTE